MKEKSPLIYSDIDWLKLWQNERTQKSWRSKGAEDWDKKASSFAQRHSHSPYISLFLSRLPLRPSYTVLDVGSGPGTLALPLARQVRSVTAIDYSKKMLDILEDHAEGEGLTNITCRQCSWEDDWEINNIEPADIAIASRSMNLPDLAMAIDKLNSYGKKYVFIADRIAPSPFDPDAFAAIGRKFNSGPDYIYTINLLYAKNIHPHVEILQLEPLIEFKNMAEALESYKWMIKDLTPEELVKLENYINSQAIVQTRDKIVLKRKHPPRWALIWWKKGDIG